MRLGYPQALPLLHRADIAESQRQVVAFASPPGSGANYFDALDMIQPYALAVAASDTTPVVDLNPLESSCAPIMSSLQSRPESAEYVHLETFKLEDISWLEKLHLDALSLLDKYSTYAQFLVSQLVARCLVARSTNYRSASFPFALGAVWIGPEERWTSLEYAESLLHETTHQAFYLDDMVHGPFAESLSTLDQPENRIVSAVRKVERRYDQAFHAATVATVLADFREHFGPSGFPAEERASLFGAVSALQTRSNVLTDRGKSVLGEMLDCTRILD